MLSRSRVFVLGVIGGFLLALAPSCGPGHCQLGDCTGCCTSAGVCMTGTVEAFCGRSGAACQVCASGDSCNGNGVCVGPFGNPGTGGGNAGTGGGSAGTGGGNGITCPGCVFNGQCVQAPNNANPNTCGTNGQPCQDCTQQGAVCSSFQCVPNGGGCSDGCLRADGSCAHAPDNSLNGSCGPPGGGCQVCPSGMMCQTDRCRPSGMGGGTGGGTGGGSAGGTGGGTGGGCFQVPPVGPFNPSRGFHALDAGFGRTSDWGARIVASGSILGTGFTDVVAVDRFATPLRPALFPRSVVLGPTSNFSCLDCVHYGANCNLDAGVCARIFLAQSGTVSYQTGTETVLGGVSVSGSFAGSGMSLHFVEWSIGTDAPLPGGACVDLSNMGWNAKWP